MTAKYVDSTCIVFSCVEHFCKLIFLPIVTTSCSACLVLALILLVYFT